MKFTPKEDFRHGAQTFEAGNTYDSEKYEGVSDADVYVFHAAGWAEVEGLDPAPARQVRGVAVQPDNARHAQTAQEPTNG